MTAIASKRGVRHHSSSTEMTFVNEFAFWSRQPYFCLNFQLEALIVSVCLCGLSGEPAGGSGPAAQGRMGTPGYPSQGLAAARGARGGKVGDIVPKHPAGVPDLLLWTQTRKL